MSNELTKAEFKKEFNYSESTYHRRMKEFKDSPFSEGYKAVTAKEILINPEMFNQFRVWKADNRFRVKRAK